MKVFCNDTLVDKDSVAEVFEPGFLFGWGVFETLRAYKGKVPFLDRHVRRLDAGLARIGIEGTKVDYAQAITKLLKENSLDDAYIRITAYKKRESTGVLIYVDKFGYYPDSAYEKGFTAIISKYKRDASNPLYNIKAISNLENRLAWHEAQLAKKDEALVLNKKGYLAGGSRSNIFLVKNNKAFTPSIENGAFCGITRGMIIKELNNSRIKVFSKQLTVKDLLSADEAFLTSALLEVMPLVECGGTLIGNGKPGPLTLKTLSRYRELLK